MAKIGICFGISGRFFCSSVPFYVEEQYVSVFKKTMSFLYSCEHIPCSFYFPGPLLEWMERSHEEFFMVLSEMQDRKQIEIIGGGYYDPLFPLIPPSDRVGQIELMTTALRKITGKRPRGCWITGSAWDPSFVSSCSTCGMEYVLLDKSLLQDGYNRSRIPYEPVIVEDMGKTVCVLPLDTEIFRVRDRSPRDVFSMLKDTCSSIDTSACVCAFLDLSGWKDLIAEKEWFDEFFSLVTENPDVAELTTPGKYIRSLQQIRRGVVSSGAAPCVGEWSISPYVRAQNVSGDLFFSRSSVKQFPLLYPEVLNIYSRMMYTHLLVNQIRGDKIRKNTAREELWQAQACDGYWFTGSDGMCNPEVRQNAYSHFIQADRLSRGGLPSTGSVVSFDFDMDGIKEYLFQFTQMNMYVHLRGGHVFELDIFSNCRNYADTMGRTSVFDGTEDVYPRRIFIDHLTDDASFDDFIKNPGAAGTVFPSVLYQEMLVDRARHEVFLKASGAFGALRVPVSLKKNYTVSENSVKVQYILKNEGPFAAAGWFAVESNLSLPGCGEKEQKVEVIENDEKRVLPPPSQFRSSSGISYVQVDDIVSDVQFVFEPNENAGISVSPLVITRPLGGKMAPRYQATTLVFFWHMDLAPGYETAQPLSCRIVTGRKRRPSRQPKIL